MKKGSGESMEIQYAALTDNPFILEGIQDICNLEKQEPEGEKDS